MFKKFFLLVALGVFFVSCATVPTNSTPPAPQEVVVKVKAEDPAKVTVKEESKEDRMVKSMEVHNPEGRLSQLSFISKDKAFVKIFSGLSVADVTRLWNDLVVLENNTEIRDVIRDATDRMLTYFSNVGWRLLDIDGKTHNMGAEALTGAPIYDAAYAMLFLRVGKTVYPEKWGKMYDDYIYNRLMAKRVGRHVSLQPWRP